MEKMSKKERSKLVLDTMMMVGEELDVSVKDMLRPELVSQRVSLARQYLCYLLKPVMEAAELGGVLGGRDAQAMYGVYKLSREKVARDQAVKERLGAMAVSLGLPEHIDFLGWNKG